MCSLLAVGSAQNQQSHDKGAERKGATGAGGRGRGRGKGKGRGTTMIAEGEHGGGEGKEGAGPTKCEGEGEVKEEGEEGEEGEVLGAVMAALKQDEQTLAGIDKGGRWPSGGAEAPPTSTGEERGGKRIGTQCQEPVGTANQVSV